MSKIEIPEYSKEDFIDGTEPFEFLYQYHDDGFTEGQLKHRLSDMAKAVGVKNFNTLYNAFLKSTKGQKSASSGFTDFSGQPLELQCGDYVCDDYGVTGWSNGFETVVCNHPIMPIERLVNIDSDCEKMKIAYKKRGGNWRSIIVDKKTLASQNKIVELAEYGIAVNSENSKNLVKYFTDIEGMNIDLIPETNSVGRLGWISEGEFSPYADNLIFDGDLTYKHMFESVRQKGKFEKWIDVAKQVRQGGIIGRILLSASFASVLVKPLSALPFFVHLWGGTESGKTVALMLAASVWANPAMGEYIHTFNSTQVAQELTATFVNSLPLIIDELQIVGDRKDFDKMIYQLSEGVGRSRGAKSGGLQRVGSWANCVLTTGEQPITSGTSAGGAVNRIIEIDCKDEKIFKNPVEVVAEIKKNYGFAGKMFVEMLKDNFDYAQKVQKAFYDELMKGDNTDKQVMAASVILAADKLIDEWIFNDGKTLQISDIQPFLLTKSQVSQNERAYEFLIDFIAINKNRFEMNVNADYVGECWGVIDDYNGAENYVGDCVYIIKSQFDKIMRNEGYNPTAFLSWASRTGIAISKKGRNTMMKRINGTPSNVVCLKIPDSEDIICADYDDLLEI